MRTDHLFEGAERLIKGIGKRRQADLRRATSASYYGVFHLVMQAFADEFVGATRRRSEAYALAYRRTEHRGLRTCCHELLKDPPFPKAPAPLGGLVASADLRDFARKTIALQDWRHAADYDPLARFDIVGVTGFLADGRAAAARFQQADAEARRTFLTLLAFPPR